RPGAMGKERAGPPYRGVSAKRGSAGFFSRDHGAAPSGKPSLRSAAFVQELGALLQNRLSKKSAARHRRARTDGKGGGATGPLRPGLRSGKHVLSRAFLARLWRHTARRKRPRNRQRSGNPGALVRAPSATEPLFARGVLKRPFRAAV